MAPSPAGAVAPNTIEVRMSGGILALNRFMMTLQNKRMPVSRISVEGDGASSRVRFVLGCPEEAARRYVALLEGLEDVAEVLTPGPPPEPARAEGWGAGPPGVDYDGRRFRSVANSGTGEVGAETVFRYAQEGAVVTATYEGGGVRSGTLLATVDGEGRLDARYQHVNAAGGIMTGECRTTPETLPDGRLRLHEQWRWTSGNLSAGRSIVEEIGE